MLQAADNRRVTGCRDLLLYMVPRVKPHRDYLQPSISAGDIENHETVTTQ